MSQEFDEVEKKLKKADADAPELPLGILDEATRASKRATPNPTAARFALTSVAGLAAVSIFATSIPTADQPLFKLASDSNAGQVAQESSIESDSVAVDSLPGWINPFEYTAGESLSDQAGEGVVYELVIDGNPSERLQEFAGIFNQAGNVELEEWSTDFFPSYKLETDEAYFSLYWHGSGMINYSSKRNWLDQECYLTDEELIEPDAGGGSGPREGCEPLPTVEMLSEQVLAEQALETIRLAGYQGEIEDIEVERYQWGATAFATKTVDGIDTAIEWYVSWDQTGEISNVSGHLARAENVGVFNTVSPIQAVSRINDGYWFGAAPRSFYNYSIQESVASSPPSASSSSAVEAPEEDIAPIEDDLQILPVEPLPDGEVEIRQITIEGATNATLLIEDSEGTGWLVPGYLLETDQGWFESIVALEDGVVATPE